MIKSGSIRQRRPKVWQITIELPRDPVTGKRNRIYRTVNGTKKEAERVKHDLIAEVEKGYYVTDDKITISEWIQTWLEVYVIPNVSPTTLSAYKGMIRRYIDPLIGNMRVQSLNTLGVQSWVNSLKISPSSGKEMSAKTVKHTFHVLKGAMDNAGSPCRDHPTLSLCRNYAPQGQEKAACGLQ